MKRHRQTIIVLSLLGLGSADAADAAKGPARFALHVGPGHSMAVESVAFSPDGRLLATGSSDDTVKLWDVATGFEMRTLRGHTAAVRSVHFSRSGRLRVTGGWDSLVCFWDVRTGRRLAAIRTNMIGTLNVLGLQALAVGPKGRRMATANHDTVKLWDLRTGRKARQFKAHTDAVRSLAFSPDGRVLASGSWDATAKLWDAATGRLVRTFRGHAFWVESVAFSPDGTMVASASRDDTARLWDVATGRQVAMVSAEGEDVVSVAFSPDGRLLAAGGSHGNVRLLDVRASTGQTRTLKGVPYLARVDDLRPRTGHKSDVNALAFSPDSRLLATGGADTTVRLWHVATGREVRTLTGRSKRPNSVAFSPDGRWLAVGSSDHTVRLWDPAAGRLAKTLVGHTRGVEAVVFAPSGRWLAAGGADGTVRVWDVASGREARALRSRHGQWSSVAFSPDSRLLAGASGGLGTGQTVAVWDARTGRELWTLRTPGTLSGQPAAAFSPDGRWLVTVSRDKTLRLWDMATDRPVRVAEDQTVAEDGLVQGPDGGELIALRGASVTLWEVPTWRKVRTLLLAERDPRTVAFTPNGRRLVVAGTSAHIVDVANWRRVEELSEGGGPIAVSADGRLLATGRDDSIKLWRVRTWAEARTLRGHASDLTSLAFHPDRRLLASAGLDNTVKLWNVRSGQLMATLVARVDGEWATCLPDNYYRCSPRAVDALAFVAGTRAYAFEQFDLLLNRPGLVMERLGCGDRRRIEAAQRTRQRRLARMGLREEDMRLDLDLPGIEIDHDSAPHVTTDKRINLKIKAWDQRHTLDRLMLWVNDVPIPSPGPRAAPPFSLRRQQTTRAECAIPLDLSKGTNKIQACVLNSKGIASLKSTAWVECVAETGKPDLWLVAIGVSHYRDPTLGLHLAAKDADDLASLVSRGPTKAAIERQFGKTHVLKLTDTDATRPNILETRKVLARSSVDDVAIVFVAGHGFLDEHGDYYFGTHDVDRNRPAQRGLPFGDLHGLLADIPARKKLLLLDTCHAGELDRDPASRPAPRLDDRERGRWGLPAGGVVKVRSLDTPRGVGGVRPRHDTLSLAAFSQENLFADLRRETGAAVIASCSGNEYSVERARWRNGAFTYALLECLRTGRGDANGDGKIRVAELRDYVVSRVRQLTRGGQNPTERRQNPANDFVVLDLAADVVSIGPSDKPLVHTLSAALSPDGRLLLTGHGGGIARLWDLSTGRQVGQFAGHRGGVLRVAFSPDGKTALTEGPGPDVKLWDVRTRRELGGPEKRWPTGCRVAFSPEGNVLVARAKDSVVRLMSVSAGREIRRFGGHVGGATAVAFSSDGRRLAVGCGDGRVRLWDAATGQETATFKAKGPVRAVALSSESSRLLAAGPRSAVLWDTGTGSAVKELPHESARVTVVFSRNGKRALLGGQRPGFLKLLDTASGSVVSTFGPHGNRVWCSAFSRDSKLILTGGQDESARLWDSEAGTLLRRLSGHRELLLSVAFAPDSRRAITVSGDNTARVWYVGDE